MLYVKQQIKSTKIMEDIRIVKRGEMFKVLQGDRVSLKLSFNEALGLLVSLMTSSQAPCLNWMKTREEHQNIRDMFTKEVGK